MARTNAAPISGRSPSELQPRFGARERKYVFSVAMKIVRNPDSAEDVAQEAMLRAYAKRHSFRGEAKFTTWLHRAAVTTALMHLRRQARLEAHARDELDACATMPAPGLDPEQQTIVAAQVARAGQHLARMSVRYRKIVRMSLAEGYTMREIGRELRINDATVKTRVHRGRRALRAAVDEAA